jgi:hypothetical protein
MMKSSIADRKLRSETRLIAGRRKFGASGVVVGSVPLSCVAAHTDAAGRRLPGVAALVSGALRHRVKFVDPFNLPCRSICA